MSQGMNVVLLVGTLGKDPEVRYIQSGKAVCTLRLAVTERVKRGGEWKDDTTWLDVVCWDKTAENAGKFLTKGRSVTVHGRIQVRKYQDKEGKDRYATEVVANQVVFHFGEGKSHGSGGESNREGANDAPARGATAADDAQGFVDDGLPF